MLERRGGGIKAVEPSLPTAVAVIGTHQETGSQRNRTKQKGLIVSKAQQFGPSGAPETVRIEHRQTRRVLAASGCGVVT